MTLIRAMRPDELDAVRSLIYDAYAEHGYFLKTDPEQDAISAQRKIKPYTNKIDTLIVEQDSKIVATLSYGYGIPTLVENIFGSEENKRELSKQLQGPPHQEVEMYGSSTRGSLHELFQTIKVLELFSGKLLVCTRFASAKEYWESRDGLRLGMILIREVVKISLEDKADVSAFIVNPRHVPFYRRYGAQIMAAIPNAPGLQEGKAPGVLMTLVIEEFARRIETIWPELDDSLRKRAREVSLTVPNAHWENRDALIDAI